MNYDTLLSVRQIASMPGQRNTSTTIKVYFIQKYFKVDCINRFLKIYEDSDSVLIVFKTFIYIVEKF